MNPTGRFAILIPVYNHADGIGLGDRAGPGAGACPIWVVDDGSTDGTAASLERIAGITVIRHEEEPRQGGGPPDRLCGPGRERPTGPSRSTPTGSTTPETFPA